VLVSPVPHGAFQGQAVPRVSPGEPPRAIHTAAELLDSGEAARLAARRLGGRWTAEGVRGAVRVDPIGETDVLAVLGRAGEAAEAARVANAFATSAVEARTAAVREQVDAEIARLGPRSGLSGWFRRQRLEANREALARTYVVLAPASTPGAPTGAGPARILVISLLAGLALGSVAALVADALRRRAADKPGPGVPAPGERPVPDREREDPRPRLPAR
jgi:uncharacterized protein involved in exopolysaccharide biosynthesis